jgi:hypothetical protein
MPTETHKKVKCEKCWISTLPPDFLSSHGSGMLAKKLQLKKEKLI